MRRPIVSDPTPLDRAAVEYAEAGRVVFPLGGEDGKHPRVRWSGLEPGGRHVIQVRAWWRRWPGANIGLRTGDGLAVLDVDTRHGGTIDPAWPTTRTSQTRSGGFHLLYRSAGGVRCSVAEVGRGVDVRGDGGYIVAPPSPGWRWINDLPLAPFPVWVNRGATGREQREGDPLPRDWRPFEIREVVADGGRNSYLAQLAGWLLREGISGMDLERFLLDFNAEACRPPLDADEVLAVAASIERYHR